MRRIAGMSVWLLLISMVMTIGNDGDGYAAGVNKVVGVNVDATTPPVLPCTTFGFSIDATNTLPVGANNVRMLRVDRTVSNSVKLGYALTSEATGYRVYVFDITTMAVLGTITNTITGYRDAGRLQGDVSTVDGKLYVFNEVNNANPGCTTSNCVMVSRWSGTTLESAVVDNTGTRVDNIDDARESSNNFLVAVSRASAPLVREFRTYSKSGLVLVAAGTQTSSSAFMHIGRSLSGRLYAMQGVLLSPNIWTFATDSATADNTAAIGFTAGLFIGAAYPTPTITSEFITFDSNVSGATTPQRAYVTPPVTAAGPQNFSGGAAVDFGASFQGSSWDTINERVFALRQDTTSTFGVAQRTTNGLTGPFTTEQNFSCGAQCANSGGMDGGAQIVDYSQQYGRMYVGSNESPARVTRIKVCATGGPGV